MNRIDRIQKTTPCLALILFILFILSKNASSQITGPFAYLARGSTPSMFRTKKSIRRRLP